MSEVANDDSNVLPLIKPPAQTQVVQVERHLPSGMKENCTVYDEASKAFLKRIPIAEFSLDAVLSRWGSGRYLFQYYDSRRNGAATLCGKSAIIELLDPAHPPKPAQQGGPGFAATKPQQSLNNATTANSPTELIAFQRATWELQQQGLQRERTEMEDRRRRDREDDERRRRDERDEWDRREAQADARRKREREEDEDRRKRDREDWERRLKEQDLAHTRALQMEEAKTKQMLELERERHRMQLEIIAKTPEKDDSAILDALEDLGKKMEKPSADGGILASLAPVLGQLVAAGLQSRGMMPPPAPQQLPPALPPHQYARAPQQRAPQPRQNFAPPSMSDDPLSAPLPRSPFSPVRSNGVPPQNGGSAVSSPPSSPSSEPAASS